MSVQWREGFEAQFLSGFPDKMRSAIFVIGESGEYLKPGVQSEWERYRAHRAIEEFKTAIIKALRIEQIAAWLNHKTERGRK